MTVPASASVDVLVVGSGLVGLATARAVVSRCAGAAVAVVDKEDRVAAHQSSHNSGVLHSGLYYRPGSEKARLCRRGRELVLDLCRQEAIAHELCGKVVVATRPDELARLDELRRRAAANGVRVDLVGPSGLADVEPYARGLAALVVPDTGVVDFADVARRLARRLDDEGTALHLGVAVHRIVREGRTVRVTGARADDGRPVELRARVVVNCAGLGSDRLAGAEATGPGGRIRIVPFRGEYRTLGPADAARVRHLIYPVPDPRFPFLGVHLTRGVDGVVRAGPDAVLALGREAYRRGDRRAADVRALVRDPAVWRLAGRHWRTGAGELARSRSRRLSVRAVQQLVPGVEGGGLERSGAGVRAQAVDDRGRLVDDFVFGGDERVVHVLNAPSPAATASLAIGEVIADRVLAAVAPTVGRTVG